MEDKFQRVLVYGHSSQVYGQRSGGREWAHIQSSRAPRRPCNAWAVSRTCGSFGLSFNPLFCQLRCVLGKVNGRGCCFCFFFVVGFFFCFCFLVLLSPPAAPRPHASSPSYVDVFSYSAWRRQASGTRRLLLSTARPIPSMLSVGTGSAKPPSATAFVPCVRPYRNPMRTAAPTPLF